MSAETSTTVLSDVSPALAALPVLVWCTGGDGALRWAGPQWTRYTGLSLEASQGMGWLSAIPEAERTAMVGSLREAKAGGLFKVEHRLIGIGQREPAWYRTEFAAMENIADCWIATSVEIDDLVRKVAAQRSALAELRHRVRNVLANLRSIARRTGESSLTPEDFVADLDGRIGAVTRAQAAVLASADGGMDLFGIVAAELGVYAIREGGRAAIEGPQVRVPNRVGESLILALHELATNSVKHGALHYAGGLVNVAWHVQGSGAARRLALRWKETGLTKPPVQLREGFGNELLRRSLPYEIGAVTSVCFEEDGVRATLDVPLPEAAA
ncbi:hypothetical protein IAI18_01830 [Acetobacteraceae bacterium H6797]|nr:hypothetical protein [Acetobacteraceae bacterium H6797]